MAFVGKVTLSVIKFGISKGSIYMTSVRFLSACFGCLILLYDFVSGHGRLVEPPSRSSMWRSGFDTPRNYMDNELSCGGFAVQWEKNGGRCGVCGDPWDGPRDNEAGGKYANGVIVREYQPGGTLRTTIELTAPHKGFFEFRICPNNDPLTPVTQECLDRHVLSLNGDGRKRIAITDPKPRKYSFDLQLPYGLMCSQCVLQWKYNAGNNWGVDDNRKACVGCGPQEQFYACADVVIRNRHKPLLKQAPRVSSGDWASKEGRNIEAAFYKEGSNQDPNYGYNARDEIDARSYGDRITQLAGRHSSNSQSNVDRYDSYGRQIAGRHASTDSKLTQMMDTTCRSKERVLWRILDEIEALRDIILHMSSR